MLFLHPLMVHSIGVNSAAQGTGDIRLATVMEWQLQRPPLTTSGSDSSSKRMLWWALTDSSRAIARGPHDSLECATCTILPVPLRTAQEQARAHTLCAWRLLLTVY